MTMATIMAGLGEKQTPWRVDSLYHVIVYAQLNNRHREERDAPSLPSARVADSHARGRGAERWAWRIDFLRAALVWRRIWRE